MKDKDDKEFCKCGHTRDDHLDNVSGMVGIHGHGMCDMPNCDCVRFTWMPTEKVIRNGVYDY